MSRNKKRNGKKSNRTREEKIKDKRMNKEKA
jgi:hypothetical protein